MKLTIRKVSCYLMICMVLVCLFGVRPINAASNDARTYVSYINVGESDCVLIQSEGHSMLIDAGSSNDGDDIVNYLTKQKIKTLDYVICTHPHADHIGGMSEVINSFAVNKIIAPAIAHTTDTFENLLKAIKKKGLKLTKPVVGAQYTLGRAAFVIIAPNKDQYGSNINNYSVGIKLTNGRNSFVFIGDNETEAIADILKNKIDLTAEVYMCGHHGSNTSTTAELLKAIKPEYAVISVGKNNYGHPGDHTLKLLANNKISIYRTDKNGTITAVSDGKNISFQTEKGTFEQGKASSEADKQDTTVYITKTGKKYHKAFCSMLKSSKIKITLKKAKAEGYQPCSRCHPPE